MTIYSIFSLILLIPIIFVPALFLFKYIDKNRSGRIEFVRSFKMGDCIWMYISAIPLYWIGMIYQSNGKMLLSLFNAIKLSLGLVVLDYDTSDISNLMADEPIYNFAIFLSFFLVTLNALLFALSLFSQTLWEKCQIHAFNKSKKEKLVIVGNNEDSLKVYLSEKTRDAMILDDLGKDEKAELYIKGIRYISKSGKDSGKTEADGEISGTEIEKYCCRQLTDCFSDSKRSLVMVINTRDDKKNISLCHKIIEATKQYFLNKENKEKAGMLSRIRIYVFGSADYAAIYADLVKMSKGSIHYVNKHRQIAIDFIDKYPLTAFMTDEQIDYDTSLIRKGVKINVALIGFGKTNRQLLLTSVANNQFLSLNDNGEIAFKPVNYYIFDKEHAEKNKNLNHSYYRFKNEFEQKIKEQEEGDRDSYLPFPALPAEEKYEKLNVNDPDIYKNIEAALSGSNSFNYVVISYGSDLENVDMAKKIIEKKQEWALENTYIFVRIKDGNDYYDIFNRDDCFMIGEDTQTIYNIEKIVNGRFENMAMMRNRLYALERKITEKKQETDDDHGAENSPVSVEDVYAEADCDWYIRNTQFERESNLYACLSLRSKLHLMGLDYVPENAKGNPNAMENSDYLDIYAKGDLPVYYDDLFAEGKQIVKYGLDFKDSRRKTMAIHEHSRWNSYMLTQGFVPSSKHDILTDGKKGKNYLLRRHGNLTSFDGLLEFRRMVAKQQGKQEIETDVIKYDYQLLDDAYWLLSKNGYRIVKKH